MDQDHHHHLHGETQGVARLWWVLVMTLGYMIAEIIGGFMSGSLALLADAGHMAIDAAATALGLFAAWIATKPPDSEKTYGYYRAEILAALLNGATLIAISFWVLYEAWNRFTTPQVVRGELMAGVAGGGLIINILSLAAMSRHRSTNLNLRGVWLHIMTDAIGSVAAIAAALMVWKWEWYRADPISSVLIGLLILFGSWKLVAECVNVLLEGVPKGINVHEIQEGLKSIAQVSEVHDLHVWTLTTGVPSLSAHIKINDERAASKILLDITEFLRQRHHIEHVTLQLEPPGYDHKLTRV